MSLADAEDVSDDVLRRVAFVPERAEDLVRLINLAAHAVPNHLFD